MKTEDIFRILNNGKRLAHYEQKEPKKRTLTTILMNYTGKSIKKKVSEALETLKNDLTIVFQPVKRFTKKQLQPADTTTLYSTNVDGNNDAPSKSAGNQEKPAKSVTSNDTFVNWFDLGKNDKNSENSENEEKNVKKNNVITLTRADGTKTTLDEDLDRLIF